MTGMIARPLDTEWTVDELDRIPDDGLQYELLDGMLLVSPAPVMRHQRAISRLLVLLTEQCPLDSEVFVAPLDWRPDPRTSLQPDLLVARKIDLEERNLTKPLLLAVEVLSPSTRRKDLLLKRSKYEEAGVGSYWIVDPSEPLIVALDLIDGAYVTAGQASGNDTVMLQRPFPVTVTPSALVE